MVRSRAADPRSDAVEDLIRAADLDLFGQSPDQRFIYEIEWAEDEKIVVHSLVFRASDTYEVSGTVAALAALAVLDGAILPGLHHASDVLPIDVVERVRGMPGVTAFEFKAGPAVGDRDFEEDAF